MTQDKIKQIHRWYGWFLAATLVALGILVILSCLAIYTSGPRPYSAEAIALQFQRILIPVIVSLIGIVGGIALNLLLPPDRKRPKSVSHPEDIMLRLREKAAAAPVQKEVRLRLILRVATALCFTGLMIYPLIYFLTPGRFSVSELNADVVRAVLLALISAAIGLVLCWICRAFLIRSFQREAAVYKQALAAGEKSTLQKKSTQSQNHSRALTVIRVVIAAAAVIFIIFGILNGGAEDVLKKAVAICTECIGLG